MAYMNQERKAAKMPAIKAICKEYGIKASVSVHNYSTLYLNIKSGSIDFLGNYNKVAGHRFESDPARFHPAEKNLSVNPYWYKDHFDGKAVEFLEKVLAVMNEGNHNRSDMMTDYFDVGWYVDVNVGRWNQDYVCTGEA